MFHKRDENMELVSCFGHVFMCCEKVEIQVSMFLLRVRHVSSTELSSHVRHMSFSRFPVKVNASVFPLCWKKEAPMQK